MKSMATIGNKTVSTSDFVDFANQDFRIARSSPLYKGMVELETLVRTSVRF